MAGRRTKPIEPLTQVEREFAEENHGLILWYLKHKKFSIDEWYDVVVFGYLDAVKQWFRNPKKFLGWTFSVVAKNRMNDSVCTHLIYLNREMRAGTPPISLDAFIGNSENPFLNVISDPSTEDIQQIALLRVHMDKFISTLSQRKASILKLRLQGYSSKETGATLGISEHTAKTCFRKIKGLLNQQLAE